MGFSLFGSYHGRNRVIRVAQNPLLSHGHVGVSNPGFQRARYQSLWVPGGVRLPPEPKDFDIVWTLAERRELVPDDWYRNWVP